MRYNFFERFIWNLRMVDFSRNISRMPCPFFNGTSRDNGQKALKNVITAPVVGSVDIGHDHRWDIKFEGAANTKNLWFHSLPFVGDLLVSYEDSQDNRYLKKLFELIASYLNWLSSTPQSPAWIDEHAVSNRARMLCYVLYASEIQSFRIPPSVFALIDKSLIKHGEWLRDDNHYVSNNHGTMADRALIEISLSPTSISNEINKEWQDHALSRLHKILALTFDHDGCCIENSPSYHVFNTYIFSSINDFLVDNGVATDKDAFNGVLAKATAVMPLFFRIDGTFPIIGDTEIRPTHWVDTTKMREGKGIGFFPRSGFFIHKGDNLYFTAKCGGSSFTHKHVDDTSITLNYGGEDFIVDSGYLNYDIQNDRMARYIRSYKSHSGIFTEDCDKVRFAKFANAGDMGTIDKINNETGLWSLNMNSYLDPNAEISRTVICENEQLIHIEDRVRSEQPVFAHQQFIIHPECLVEIDGTTVRIDRTNTSLHLSFNSLTPFKVVLENCVISETFGSTKPAKRVSVIAQSSNVVISTTITVEKGNPSAKSY